MNKLFDLFGGRKYFLVLFFWAILTAAFFCKWAPVDVWMEGLKWLLVTYIGANVLKGIPDAIAASPTDPEDNKFFVWFGGRKMFTALLFIATLTAAFFIPQGDGVHYVTAEKWVEGMQWYVTIYLGGNALDAVPRVIAKKLNNGKGKTIDDPSENNTPVSEA